MTPGLVRLGVPSGSAAFVANRTMSVALLSKRPHTHRAPDDAVEQAELPANPMPWPGHRAPDDAVEQAELPASLMRWPGRG
ncbi:hypothetical protein OG352_34065 [Streptomyces sp. NBC_01485]|uniref:hypothetical protein n=1 Tax=Streptomyces sp. NBC_01485 TaxID=2903884 RepID=UPI002E37105C|nr:hypothetical protein [Streptomyces sp. NBC_01485]